MPNFGDAVAVENPGGVNTQAIVTCAGYTLIVPLSVCQSFMAFQAWVSQNSIANVPAGDQAGWTDMFAGVGITMGA